MEDENKEKEIVLDGATDEALAEVEGSQELSVEELQKQLAEEKKKSAEYMDSWQRSRADFMNLKRRTEIERANVSSEARAKVILRLLPIVDDFERAMSTLPDNLKNEPWVNGVSLIEKKLKTLLDQEGVTEITAQDADFDPRFHEAVQQDEDSSGNKEYVTAVFQKGYKMGDKVIRPAAVKVGRR